MVYAEEKGDPRNRGGDGKIQKRESLLLMRNDIEVVGEDGIGMV